MLAGGGIGVGCWGLDDRVRVSTKNLGPKSQESRDGAHNALQCEVCSGAISDGPGASEEDSLCLPSRETFKSWSD